MAVETLVGIGIVLCAGAALAAWRVRRSAGRRRFDHVLPGDEAWELDSLGRALLAEHHLVVGAPLTATLERVRARGVPLSTIRRNGGVRRQFVLGFADGSGVLASPRGRADAGLLLFAMRRCSVLVHRWADEGDVFVVELAWPDGRSLWEAVALPNRAVSA